MKIKQIFLASTLVLLAFAIKAQANSNSVTLSTPSSGNGQTWTNNSTQNIQWTIPTTGSAANANISLIPYSSSGCSTAAYGNTTTCYNSSPYIIASNVPNNGAYSGNIGTDITGRAIPAGQYLVNVYDSNNNNLAATGTSAQIITIPSYNSNYTAPGSFSIYPNSGAPGSVVTLNGYGLATSTNAYIEFGNGTYVTATGNTNGNSLQFTIPTYTQPCSSSSYPATVTNNPNTSTAMGNCSTASGSIMPGTYNITVNSNGTTYTLPFTVTNSSGSTASSPTSSQTGNLALSQTSAAPGGIITITGTGLPTSTNAYIEFGNGTYVTATGNPNGNSLTFTVPTYTQPCSSSSYPATSTNSSSTYTSLGTCGSTSSAFTPGSYNIMVNANGTTYTLPFTLTASSATTPVTTPGTGLTMPSNTFADGTLVQVSGNPTVYLVSNGQFEPFSSATIFLGRGYQWSQIQTVPQSEFNSQLLSTTPVLAANGSIIKTADNPTIYLVTNGQKSGIPSMSVFNRLGLNLSNLMIVSNQELQNYPSAPDQM